MIPRWKPEYDPILIKLHALGMTDAAITGRMLDSGIAVSIGDVAARRGPLNLPQNKCSPSAEIITSYKDKPNPLAEAKRWLGSHLVEKPDGYYLDGNPVNLDQIMQKYNHMRVAMNLEQITINPRWKI